MAENSVEGLREVNTRAQVAAFLNVDPKTVSREIQRGNMKCMHVGRAIRITRQQVAAYMARQGARDE